MNLACPQCSTVYRLDPARVPGEGADARCRECGAVMRIDPQGSDRPGHVVTAALRRADHDAAPNPSGAGPATHRPSSAEAAPHAEPAPTRETAPASDPAPAASPGTGAPVFGPQDPDTRARRLARALVSDIKVYNREKWTESQGAGTLRTEFRDEILKSWDEYVEQVGQELARKTPHFRDALNDILAGGDRVF
jgi:predicted Zn finger-like uncharacterized protein